jgi:type IV secretory pathway VirB6-like protein
MVGIILRMETGSRATAHRTFLDTTPETTSSSPILASHPPTHYITLIVEFLSISKTIILAFIITFDALMYIFLFLYAGF